MKSVICSVTAGSVLLAAGIFTFNALADNEKDVETLSFDVAQTSIMYKQNNVQEAKGQEKFSRGDTAIIDGAIYSAGTLKTGKVTNDPKNRAIGTYSWRGTYTKDFFEFERAAAHQLGAAKVIAFATEMFSLPNDDGTTILTDGVWPNAYFTVRRVVLGGTGQFRNAVGEVTEENLGENETGFCNLRVTFRVTKVVGPSGRD